MILDNTIVIGNGIGLPVSQATDNSCKVVILNGPPNSGKDAIAAYFKQFNGVHHKEFKKPIFDIALAVAQIGRDEFFKVYNDRALKETPDPRLFNRSPRDHLIHTSETLIKPVYGTEYFGEVFASSLKEGLNISSDGGFIEELQPTIRKVGKENVLIIRLHRDGSNFDNDSRDYLYNTGCYEVDIDNDGSLGDLYRQVQNEITDLLGD